MSNTPHYGPPKRGGSKMVMGTLMAITVGIGVVSVVTSFIPGLGQVLSTPLMAIGHVFDRIKNGTEASDELKYRAEYYTAQIYTQLEKQGVRTDRSRKANVAEFKKAASVNPELAKLYKTPILKKNKENRESLLTNGGIALAGTFAYGAGAVAGIAEAGKTGLEVTHAAKIIAGTVNVAKTLLPTVAGQLAGGALAKAISGEHVDPQTLVEAMHETIADAKQKGIDPSTVVEPKMVFLLRLAQNPQLAEGIKQTIGHGKVPFQKMSEQDQDRVMLAYPALANAATSEAYAITHDILPVQELGASKPNLDSVANQYVVGARNSSFADRITAQRAVAAQRNGISA